MVEFFDIMENVTFSVCRSFQSRENREWWGRIMTMQTQILSDI